MSEERLFDARVSDGVCRLARSGTRWLSTGWDGGESVGPVAYNITVPEGWPETDLDAYVDTRLREAGFGESGPTLLTGVSQSHARRASIDCVEAVATAGVSNPAALPVGTLDAESPSGEQTQPTPVDGGTDDPPVGTVNVLVGTSQSLAPGALSNLVAVAAEAKAATLLATTGVPGTTTDAIVAACDPDGPRSRFSGSATPVGRAARACVRDAVLASLRSRYDDADPPSVDDAPYGVVTDEHAEVSPL